MSITVTESNAKIQTDIIPRIGISNDLMKIYNTTSVKQPGDMLLINNLLNLLETRKGLNKEFPDIGLADELLKISFSNRNNISSKLEDLKNEMTKILNHTGISISYKVKDEEDPQSDIVIYIELDDLPGNIFIDLPYAGKNSRAIETKYARE